MKLLNAMSSIYFNNDVIKWKHFPRYWPFVRGIHQWPVDTQHKGQWRGALMFDLRLNKRLSKQSRRWWFETPPRSLWRQRNIYVYPGTLPSLKIMNISCQLWEGSKKQFLRRGEINEVDWQVDGTSYDLLECKHIICNICVVTLDLLLTGYNWLIIGQKTRTRWGREDTKSAFSLCLYNECKLFCIKHRE